SNERELFHTASALTPTGLLHAPVTTASSNATPSPPLDPSSRENLPPPLMCHAPTAKGSQLSLDQCDEILSPFFKSAPSGRVAVAAAAAAATTDEEAATHPPSPQGDRHRDRQAMADPRGDCSAGGASGGAPAKSGEVDPCSRGDTAAAAADSPAPEANAVPSETPHRPPRGSKRSRKKIRFTGAMGQFLDGRGVWNDFAVMEAERKAGLNMPQFLQQPDH
ncbi:unnamed protein product, partial [Ectocarpus sp. 12 AP-2014]